MGGACNGRGMMQWEGHAMGGACNGRSSQWEGHEVGGACSGRGLQWEGHVVNYMETSKPHPSNAINEN